MVQLLDHLLFEDDSWLHYVYCLLEAHFEEFLNTSRDEAAVVTTHAFALGIILGVAAVVFAPFDVKSLGVPLSEGSSTFIINLHLLGHNSVLLIALNIAPGDFQVALVVNIVSKSHADDNVAALDEDLLSTSISVLDVIQDFLLIILR